MHFKTLTESTPMAKINGITLILTKSNLMKLSRNLLKAKSNTRNYAGTYFCQINLNKTFME